ncbi:hypothetical protein [Massilia mucilaginosa]|uniref:hypothetical protein n=1 Tax=Massilia mucilaginosa TaxID=2609282 RepID=UPI001422864A|nr:hypothetical protein [Massilia mucilaginosa]
MPDLTIKRITRMNLIYAFCLMTTQFAASSGMSAIIGVMRASFRCISERQEA